MDIILGVVISMLRHEHYLNKDKCKNQCFYQTIAVAPPPGSIAILYSTLSSLTVSWSAALTENLNGNIQKYEIQYQPDSDVADAQAALEEVLGSSLEVEYTIEDLAPETNHIIRVSYLFFFSKGHTL